MKLSLKLSLSMALLVLMLCGLGLFSIFQVNNYNNAATELSDVWLPSSRCAQDMYATALDFRTQEVLHIFSVRPERKVEYERNMTSLSNQLKEDMEKYTRYISVPEERETLRRFDSQWSDYMRFHEGLLKLSYEGKSEEASEKIRLESVKIFRDALAEIDNLVAINTKGSNAVKEECNRLYSSFITLTSIVIVIAMLIGIAVALYLIRVTHMQLGKDPAELQQIAKRVVGGDYNIDDGSNRLGVYGSIVEMVSALRKHIDHAQTESENAKVQTEKAMESMKKAEIASNEANKKTETMLKAADQLEAVGNVVGSATTELSAQFEQLDRASTESSQRLSEAATAMNEMNSTVQEVARNAASASTTSNETKQKAQVGAQVVEKAVTSIGRIHDMSLELKQDMVQLNEHAQNITRIMNVISDIADQTNLLALNAAIEAARAGEAGRGFAVVADEVRKLAEKTMASTLDVGNTIKSIQESTTKSMTSVDQTVEQIGETTTLASESGKALQEIVTMVESTSDQVNAIATASEQQSAASEEINETLLQVNDMSKQTASAMVQANQAVSDVAGQTQKLNDLIKELKK